MSRRPYRDARPFSADCTISYIENVIAEGELAATQPRIQERIKQVAARNATNLTGPQWNGFYSSPAPTPLNRLKRVGT